MRSVLGGLDVCDDDYGNYDDDKIVCFLYQSMPPECLPYAKQALKILRDTDSLLSVSPEDDDMTILGDLINNAIYRDQPEYLDLLLKYAPPGYLEQDPDNIIKNLADEALGCLRKLEGMERMPAVASSELAKSTSGKWLGKILGGLKGLLKASMTSPDYEPVIEDLLEKYDQLQQQAMSEPSR